MRFILLILLIIMPAQAFATADGNAVEYVKDSKNLGVGIKSPQAKLHVNGSTILDNGNLVITTSTPVNGYVLSTDGNGLATWMSATSLSGAGDDLGNHTASTTLDLATNDISNGGTITANNFIGGTFNGTFLGNGNGLEFNGNTLRNVTIITSNINGSLDFSNGTILQTTTTSNPILWDANLEFSGDMVQQAGYVFKVFGAPSGDPQPALYSNNGQTGINTDTPLTDLDVNGQIMIREGSPGYGKVLTSDANGLATWVDPSTLASNGDDLGNHTATTTLNMSSNKIINATTINGSTVNATNFFGSFNGSFLGDASGLNNVSNADTANFADTATSAGTATTATNLSGGSINSATLEDITLNGVMNFSATGMIQNGSLNGSTIIDNGSLTITTSTPTDGYVLVTNSSGVATWTNPSTISSNGDDLGNHTATTTLNMSSNKIINATTINGSTVNATNFYGGTFNGTFVGDGSGLTGLGSSEWNDQGTFLHPADLSGAEGVVIGGTTIANGDIILYADGSAVFNEQGLDSNFRIESSVSSNSLIVDGGTGYVGIGASGPYATLTVTGNGNNGGIAVTNFVSSDEYGILRGPVSGNGTPAADSFRIKYKNNFNGAGQDYLVFDKTDGNSAAPDGGIAFTNTGNGNVEVTSMVIRGSGNVGIGLKNPLALLHVNGDILANTINGTFVGDGSGLTGLGSSEWNDQGTFLHPADLSGAEGVVIGGTTIANGDIILHSNGHAVFNEQGLDRNFRIETAESQYGLTVNGYTGHVGINTNVTGFNQLLVKNSSPIGTSLGIELSHEDYFSQIVFQGLESNGDGIRKWYVGATGDTRSAANGGKNAFYIFQKSNKNDASVNGYRMVIDDNGYTAIGVMNPETLLEVGDGTADFISGGDDVLIANDLEVDGTVYASVFNGTFIGNGAGLTGINGGASAINDLSDAKAGTTAAKPLYLGTGAGNSDSASNSTYNLGIGYQSLYSSNSDDTGNTAVGYEALYTNNGDNNTALGIHALYGNTTGNDNTAIGGSSLRLNRANNNTAVGSASLYDNTTGTYNSVLGYHAGYNNVSGSFNVYFGAESSVENVAGNYNTAVGVQAGYGSSGQSSSNGTFLGYNAGRFNSTGDNNTFIGFSAGYSVNSGSNNITLGYMAGQNLTTGSSNIIIGPNNDAPNASASNQLDIANTIYGDTSTGNVGIGENITSSKLTVGGDLALKEGSAATAASGYGKLYVLSTDSELYYDADDQTAFRLTNNGALAVSGGVSAINDLSDAKTSGNNSIYLGSGAGDAHSGTTYSTAVGIDALKNNNINTDNNTAIGYQSLMTNNGGNIAGGGDNNSALGYQTLYSNTSGYSNTAVGRRTLYFNTSGYNNTAVGDTALFSNTTGYYNTAVGDNALFSNTTGYDNVAIGFDTMYENESGYNNVAMGRASLRWIINGSLNTAIGYDACNEVQFNGNTCIGAYTMENAGTVAATQYNTAIGYAALENIEGGYNAALGANAGRPNSKTSQNIMNGVYLGAYTGSALTNGDNNIFIGYQAGDNVTSGSTNLIIGYNVDAPVATSSNQMSIGNLIFGTGVDGTGTTLSSGNVGIGINSPQARLHINGAVLATSFNGTFIGDGSGLTGGSLKLNSGTVTAGSSELEIDLSSYIAQGVTEYVLKLYNVAVATDGVYLNMQVSTDAGSSYITTSSYAYSGSVAISGSLNNTGCNSSGQTTLYLNCGYSIDNTSSYGPTTGVIEFTVDSNFVSDAFLKYQRYNASDMLTASIRGYNASSSVNAIKIYPNSGTFALKWILQGASF